MRYITRVTGALLFMIVTACSTEYALVGYKAEKARNYVAARDAFRLALTQASQYRDSRGSRSDSGDAQAVMLYTYELGRMTGYTCDYAEAERLLTEALRLGELMDDQFSHRTATLSELARLTYDEGKFSDSVSYYKRAVTRMSDFHLELSDPIDFALILDDYASALERTGNLELTGQIRASATAIRQNNPNKTSNFVPIYYRDVCGKN